MQARMRGEQPIGVDRRSLDGVDLLGHFHRRQFRSNPGADAAADYEAGDNRPGFMNHGKDNGSGEQRLGAEPGQTVTGFEGEYDAGGRARQGNQGKGFRSNLIELNK